MPLNLNEHSGKENHFMFVFSNQNCGITTRKLKEKVKKHIAGQIATIIKATDETPLTLASKQEGASSAIVTSEDN